MRLREGGSTSLMPAASEPAIAVSATQYLAGTYLDEAVERFGTEDGRAGLYTGVWGDDNQEPRVVDAVNSGAEVSCSLISHELQGALAPVEQKLETLATVAPKAECDVIFAADEVELTDGEVAAVKKACREDDLPLPEHAGARRVAEASGLCLLGVGDMYFTSIAFQVFGLSDRNLGVLPINELQLVASSTIVALLVCTSLAGHAIREVGHLMEKTRSSRLRPDADESRIRRLCVRSWFTAGGGTLAVLGALAVLVGLSEVRASYLAQSGIDAHQWQFLLIQLVSRQVDQPRNID